MPTALAQCVEVGASRKQRLEAGGRQRARQRLARAGVHPMSETEHAPLRANRHEAVGLRH